MRERDPGHGGSVLQGPHERALELVSELAAKYQLSSIRPLLEICRSAEDRATLSIAVLGRFKAGKSTFVNDLIGTDVLPVGVIPVTSVVTQVAYGPANGATVRFANQQTLEVGLQEIRQYVSESENPLNQKQVTLVSARVSTLKDWMSFRFIDTPGLGSTFVHNSEAAQEWLPNTDIALVAVAVDPPLSERDIELIQELFRYTPRVAILLTKVDLLTPVQLREVVEYIQIQIRTQFNQSIPIYPYSTHPEFRDIRRVVLDQFLKPVAADIEAERRRISERKLSTLIGDCEQYLALTLKSSQMLDSERATLVRQLSAESIAMNDTRLEIQLIGRDAAARTRSTIEDLLAPVEVPVRQRILRRFDEYSPQLPSAFSRLIGAFADWLRHQMEEELTSLSNSRRTKFVGPVMEVQRRYQRVLQNFRDRLSDRTFTLFGVTLRTTEPEIAPEPPKTPDVSIGRSFDHNWELVSPLLPMGILRGAVFRRFRRKIADETYKNLSRLTSQWTEIVTSTILQLQHEAERRLLDLLTTVQALIARSSEGAPDVKKDLERLHVLTGSISD